MKVTIKHLEAFTAIAQTGSFAEACDLLNLSQPALSSSIKNLEGLVGGKLFLRTTRKVRLTPEGEAFSPIAKRLLADIETSVDDVKSLFSLQRGKLDIGVMPTFANSLLAKILVDFCSQSPKIKVTVHDVVAETVVDMVKGGSVELGISFSPDDGSGLNFTPLFEDKFVVVLPRQHKLAKKTKIHWQDLQGTNFICLQRPSSIRQLIDEKLLELSFPLSANFEAHQLTTIGKMVGEGLGVSIVPQISAKQMEDFGAVSRPLHAPVIARSVGILTKKDAVLSSAGIEMMATIKRRFK
ncbi:LysR family transcriptional regulator [Dasania marina]|uniref:LysR family transcriptional regulator n=1 Tax=Dasania marina TaxID=471499 RepID=UPI00036B475E|nr:LysR family transcriptional regulator [Dasania marina]